MDELHPIQMKILTKLLFNPSLRYSEMKPDKEMENNTFQFHLDHLTKVGLVEKSSSSYALTTEGKKFAIQIKAENFKLVIQAKIGVGLGCIREKDGKTQVLIYTRLKHAYYGCQGFPAGKAEQGETFVDGAKRELLEETGLSGEPQLAGTFHYHILNQDGSELLDDLLIFLFRFTNPTGGLVSSHEGKYEWVNVETLGDYITKPFQSKEWFWEEVKAITNLNTQPIFVEKVYCDTVNF
jgi:8-oxo-dGTP pyrophosphatase MutT (NUDIX family)